MAKKKRIILIVVIIVAAAVVAGLFMKNKLFGGASGGDAAYVESVSSLMGGQNSGAQNRYSGVVESQETWNVPVSSEQSIKKIMVSEGDTVETGTPLLEYDSDDLELQLSQAKLELESIGNEISNYESQIKTLTAEKKSASKDEQFSYTTQIQELEISIKQAEYNQESKKIEIQKLQDSIEQSVVTSKIAGVVKEINENGGYDDYGNEKPFMTILATGDYRVKGKVNEQNVWSLSEGQPVILRSRVDADMTWTGTITSIDMENQESGNNNMYSGSGDSEMQSSKYPFYVTLDSNEGLILGQHLYIELDVGQEEVQEGLSLYSGYVVQEDEAAYVWADNGNGKLEKRAVEIGEYNEEMDTIQILSGLTEADFVAWPMEELKEGMPVTMNYEESILNNESEEGEVMEDGAMMEDGTIIEDGMMEDGTVVEDGMMEDGTVIEDGMTEDGTMMEDEITEDGAMMESDMTEVTE